MRAYSSEINFILIAWMRMMVDRVSVNMLNEVYSTGLVKGSTVGTIRSEIQEYEWVRSKFQFRVMKKKRDVTIDLILDGERCIQWEVLKSNIH
jgi:hypothetical protein